MNAIKNLFSIEYPIIQAGMVWCSGWRLASAVSNAGGLGLIGSGSMHPILLREHIIKCKQATNKPFGVNVPLIYSHIEQIIRVIIEEKVKIVFTSAGNPATWTSILKKEGISVVHVVSNSKFAKKAEDCGVDAVVAEGFEAGGHNGREETTTFCLIPYVGQTVSIPIIAAGGIVSGKSMLAAFSLGADAVQIGSGFAVAEESSAHIEFKKAIVNAREGDTKLMLKSLVPVRLLHNDLYLRIAEAESKGASKEELAHILGKGRAKLGMFEGNLREGELEIGQSSALINHIKPASQILAEIWEEFMNEKDRICKLDF
ncbi:MAG: 2-nitropropane dioxygenase [Sphingobacteriales bacterium]|nr:2-nitropropane dioxygenase [Sphingobacteriales bacterium]